MKIQVSELTEYGYIAPIPWHDFDDQGECGKFKRIEDCGACGFTQNNQENESI